MRYKKGITRTHMQNPEQFKSILGSILPKKQEKCFSMVAMGRVHYYINFSPRTKDCIVSSFLVMPLEESYQTKPQEVFDFDGNSKGFFDFHHVEIADNNNAFFFK